MREKNNSSKTVKEKVASVVLSQKLDTMEQDSYCSLYSSNFPAENL